MKTLAEQIKEKQAEKVALLDEMQVVVKSLEESDPNDNENNESLDAKATDINARLDTINKRLSVLLKLEESNSKSAAPNIIISQKGDHKDPMNLLVRNALCTFDAYTKRIPLAMAIEQRYGQARDFAETKAVSEFLVNKAAQNPAITSVAGWAQELTQQAYGAFLDLLTPESVVANLPLKRFSFDGFNSIYIPTRANRTKTLAGAFRAEGAPIRVGAANLSSVVLTPKSMGVIGSFTNEMFRRSTPNIEQLIRQWMIEDTSIALDGTFLGSGAASATQPAGIANSLGANTAASAGNTSADITADARGRLQQMASTGNGKTPYWVMDPQRWIGIQTSLTPAGTLAFPSAQQGLFMGYPVLTSLNVVDTEVFLIDCAVVDFAGGVPMFMGTEVATIHEEDTNPVAIGTVGTPNVVAAPARSLFQTNTSALRAVWELDWAVMRSGAVQQLTGVNW